MDWLILGTAVYASVVATATGAWAVYGVWRDRTAVKVAVRIGYVEQSPSSPYLKTSRQLDPERIDESTRLIVRAMNVGRRPIVLRHAGISIDGESFMFTGEGLGSGSLPRTLPEGDSFDIWTYMLGFRTWLKGILHPKATLKAFWVTETGKTYYGKLGKQLTRYLLGQQDDQ